MAKGQRPTNWKHGLSTTPTFYSWNAMMSRCYRVADAHYAEYGGSGITVDKRWWDFKNFLEDMGERPEGKTLDRYPNGKGNYELSNCRWATRYEQQLNRKMPKNNTSGVKGVTYHASSLMWRASASKNGKREYLYHGYSFEDAVKARKDWEAKNVK